MQLFRHPQKHPTNLLILKLTVSALVLPVLAHAPAYRVPAPAQGEVATDEVLEQAKGAVRALYLPWGRQILWNVAATTR